MSTFAKIPHTKQSIIRRSYGLICCRTHKTLGLQIILVKKPVTYYFCEFVLGRYHKNDDYHLKRLFDNMTYHEKMDILSLRFQNMWYRIYHSTPEPKFLQTAGSNISKQYVLKKTKFESTFLQDSGLRLKRLIAGSTNSEPIWEIPKGKKDTPAEGDIDTAIREFSEETNIYPEQYTILWHLTPYIETYSDYGTTYQSVFYYASAIGNWEPSIKFGNDLQVREVADIRWCSVNSLISMSLEPNTLQRLYSMFKKALEKYRGERKKRQFI